MSSDNRLFLFSPDSFTFTNLSSAIPQFDGRKVKTLTPLKNGYTWVTMRDGTCARLNDTVPLSDVRCYLSPDSLVGGASSVTAISLAENGDEWVLTDSGALNYTSGRIYPGRYRYVESLYKTTYLIAYDGLVMRPADSRRYPTPLPAESTVSYVRTDAHRIVMASDRGIASVDTRDSATLRYASSPPHISSGLTPQVMGLRTSAWSDHNTRPRHPAVIANHTRHRLRQNTRQKSAAHLRDSKR